jgi:hypothetical protein
VTAQAFTPDSALAGLLGILRLPGRLALALVLEGLEQALLSRTTLRLVGYRTGRRGSTARNCEPLRPVVRWPLTVVHLPSIVGPAEYLGRNDAGRQQQYENQ